MTSQIRKLGTCSRELTRRISVGLKSATKSLTQTIGSALAALRKRLSTAVTFWMVRAREAQTVLGLRLLIAGAAVFIAMETWRAFGFWRFGGFPWNRAPMMVPIATVAIAIPLLVAISNRIVRSVFLIFFAVATTLIIQFGFSTPGIIATVWYLIIGGALGTTYFFRRFESLQEQIRELQSFEGDTQYARLALEFVHDRCKFYLDRWVIALLALAAATGVMMTILWGDSFGAFIGTRAQKLTDAVYIVIGFFAVALITGVGVAYPANSSYTQCADLALALGRVGRKKVAFE